MHMYSSIDEASVFTWQNSRNDAIFFRANHKLDTGLQLNVYCGIKRSKML